MSVQNYLAGITVKQPNAAPATATQKRSADIIYGNRYPLPYELAPSPVANAPNQYATSPAVYEAINEKAWRVASAGKRLYRADDAQTEIAKHPVLDLLQNPNPFMRSESMLWWHMIADMELNGNAYWFLAGPERGAPQELWRLYPRHMRIVRDRDTVRSGYVYSIDGVDVPLDIAEVIHLPAPNPFDWHGYGFPSLTPATLPADTGIAMSRWNKDHFSKDAAVPAGLINIKDFVSDENFEKMKADWRNSYGGGQRKTAFMRGGVAEFQEIGLSQKEMDFVNGQAFTNEEIHGVFGTLHLLPSAGEAQIKTRERMFLERVWALLKYIGEFLSDELLPFWFARGAARLEFDDIRPRERALELEEARFTRPLLTVNEARAEQNLEPLDGGDELMVVHLEQGELLAFEREAKMDAVPEQLAPFAGPPDAPDSGENDTISQTAEENAEDREAANDDTGDAREERFQRSAMLAELTQWRAFVHRREGKATRAFVPDKLSPAVYHLTKSTMDFDRMRDLLDGVLLERSYRAFMANGSAITLNPGKIYDLTAAHYRASLLDLMSQALAIDPGTGSPVITRNQFAERGRRLVKTHFEAAYFDGLADGGVIAETLDDEERAEVDAEIAAEKEYMNAMATDVFQLVPLFREIQALQDDLSLSSLSDEERETTRARHAELLRQFVAKQARHESRIALWVNKGLKRLYELGKLSAVGNKMMEWRLGATEEHCRTCNTASGQRHRANQWKRAGIIPQGDNLECGGFKCQCSLHPTQERASGKLNRIPRKTHEH